MGKKWLNMTGMMSTIVSLVVGSLIGSSWLLFVMTLGFLFVIFNIRDWWKDFSMRNFYSATIIAIMILAVGLWTLKLAEKEKLIQQDSVVLLGVSLMAGAAITTIVLIVMWIFHSRKTGEKKWLKIYSSIIKNCSLSLE